MTQTADLELSLHRQEQNAYAVEFRFSDGDAASQADVRLGAREAALVAFDFRQLDEFWSAGELQEYGQALTVAFFGAESLRTAFAQARAASQLAGLDGAPGAWPGSVGRPART